MNGSLAAVLEAERLAERATRARVLRMGGAREAAVAAALSRYDERHPSWMAPRPAVVTRRAAPVQRKAQPARAMQMAAAAVMLATAAMTV